MNVKTVNEALDAIESGVNFLKKLNKEYDFTKLSDGSLVWNVSVDPSYTEKQVSEAREKIRKTREKYLLSQQKIALLIGGGVGQFDISKLERKESVNTKKLSQIIEYTKTL